MTAALWRVLIAIICVAIVYALLPPVSRVLGFAVTGDLLLIVRVCVAGLAVLYILRGPWPTRP